MAGGRRQWSWEDGSRKLSGGSTQFHPDLGHTHHSARDDSTRAGAIRFGIYKGCRSYMCLPCDEDIVGASELAKAEYGSAGDEWRPLAIMESAAVSGDAHNEQHQSKRIGESARASTTKAAAVGSAVKQQDSRAHGTSHIPGLEHVVAEVDYHLIHRYDVHDLGYPDFDREDTTDCSR